MRLFCTLKRVPFAWKRLPSAQHMVYLLRLPPSTPSKMALGPAARSFSFWDIAVRDVVRFYGFSPSLFTHRLPVFFELLNFIAISRALFSRERGFFARASFTTSMTVGCIDRFLDPPSPPRPCSCEFTILQTVLPPLIFSEVRKTPDRLSRKSSSRRRTSATLPTPTFSESVFSRLYTL